ncbi:hypothetical protein [Methylobacterium sp. 77]|uniref:hypothetical protein n=1 Tax=Methylobacterium sp. 77 TaxID=1101192 RepID=UPI00036C42AF
MADPAVAAVRVAAQRAVRPEPGVDPAAVAACAAALAALAALNAAEPAAEWNVVVPAAEWNVVVPGPSVVVPGPSEADRRESAAGPLAWDAAAMIPAVSGVAAWIVAIAPMRVARPIGTERRIAVISPIGTGRLIAAISPIAVTAWTVTARATAI